MEKIIWKKKYKYILCFEWHEGIYPLKGIRRVYE
jgi:hypothetical protein